MYSVPSETIIISIHVLRVEDDREEFNHAIQKVDFNPRPPCGGRRIRAHPSTDGIHFNPRPPCGGRPPVHCPDSRKHPISIHVLRVEDDILPTLSAKLTTYFNPRPPCGGRQNSLEALANYMLFQSASSVWRTTVCAFGRKKTLLYFNPRPPCGGRHDPAAGWAVDDRISIRVLRVEDDTIGSKVVATPMNFNPRPPCGGRRREERGTSGPQYFNPRPPCGGRLRRKPHHMSSTENFNPRPPCGGRPVPGSPIGWAGRFQSASSVWRTTRA